MALITTKKMLPRTTLENDSVKLTVLQKSDWQHLIDLAKDSSLWSYFPVDLSENDSFHSWLDSRITLMDEGEWLPYLVYSKTFGKYVGLTCYLSIDEPNKVIEVGGTWYGTQFHGTDVNPNCKILMMSHAFETLGFQRLEYKTDVLNERSRRAIMKLGAKEDGVLRSNRIVQGERRRDTIYYSILAKEWPEVKAKLASRIASYK
ncbi:MAG: RimJ/RimL family protein N-acetyltransferase [Marinoscillum sp.]|jgi:RimJ/RimL family protein N-acetyltransferase